MYYMCWNAKLMWNRGEQEETRKKGGTQYVCTVYTKQMKYSANNVSSIDRFLICSKQNWSAHWLAKPGNFFGLFATNKQK